MDKNIVALVREDTKTVNVKFFPDAYKENAAQFAGILGTKAYKYVTTLDLVPGDLCLVWVSGVPKVVEVQSVDNNLDIEPNSQQLYKWIAAKISPEYYNNLMEENKQIQDILESAYRTNTRRQFREVFLASVDNDTQLKLKSLTQKKD